MQNIESFKINPNLLKLDHRSWYSFESW